MTSPNPSHTPVLVEEVLRLFSPKSADRLLDATLGHGGHAKAYLDATSGSGTVVGLDADERAIAVAKQNLREYGQRVQCVVSNFVHLKDSLVGGGILPPLFHHILFDLGLGSHQLADADRGFSFTSEGPLTMAYGRLENLPPAQLPALNSLEQHLGHLPEVAEIVAELAEVDLAELIRLYGEERYALRIAGALKRHLPFTTAGELAEAVTAAVPAGYEHGRIHPATRTFQALRLAVNRELEALTVALPQAVEMLKPGGVVSVISFHSLEDRIVKQFFRSQKGTLETLTKKPVRASQAEIQRNPRSRSAKLRAARKT